MVENVDWKYLYDKAVIEIRKFQDGIKMLRCEMGEPLNDYAEAVKHLPDKKLEKDIKEDCDMCKAQAYRHINVWKDLKWNLDLVKRLKWSISEKIVNSDLPQDYKRELIRSARRGFNHKDCDELIKLWGEGKLTTDHPKFQAALKRKKTMDEYNQQRDREENEYVDYLDEARKTLTGLTDRPLTMNEDGLRRIDEIAVSVNSLLDELEKILKTNTVLPTFDLKAEVSILRQSLN